MGIWNWIFGKKDSPQSNMELNPSYNYNNEQNFFIYHQNEVKGPYNLQQLKRQFTITEDTQITTDTLNGEWYEAKYYECFDDLFNKDKDFYINEFGEIIKN
jgi:hypothetical protein